MQLRRMGRGNPRPRSPHSAIAQGASLRSFGHLGEIPHIRQRFLNPLHSFRISLSQQKTRGWSNAVIAHLGDDLQKAFLGESGFSRTNVYRMRALFLAYRGAEKIVPQLVGQISETGLPMAVAELPWGQNVVLIEQIKDLRELTPATPRASRL
jgi:hypothetical protein